MASLSVMPRVYHSVITAQREDQHIQHILRQLDVSYGEDGTVRFRGRLYVPPTARQELCDEAHQSKLSIHPGGNKMYQNVRRHFWWPGMKKDIADYVSRCLTCQQVKAEHQRPAGLLQPLLIPEWKWEHVTMDFVVGLPAT